MKIIPVVVGSTRSPKVNAVVEALTQVRTVFPDVPHFEVNAVEVPSGVAHTPLSREEMMKGAQQRAEALVALGNASHESWKYFIGLEGGLEVVHVPQGRLVFLENWAYVTDGTGKGSFGQSGAILLPDALAKTVVDDGVELSDAIDAFANGKGIRDAQGAWGVLTSNLVSRQEAFRVAVINAFSPFFNQVLYDSSAPNAKD
jgi:non-canonical (house-cleaning) NTP pyrophosphatase